MLNISFSGFAIKVLWGIFMKKFWKYLLVLLIIPISFAFVGCAENGKTIVSIEKTNSVGIVDSYTITYNDGTTSEYVVTNGKDGQEIYRDITLEDLYEAVKVKKGLGEEYTIVDFVYEYLDININPLEIASSTALRSAVTVFTEHKIKIVDYNNITGYTGGFGGMQANYGVKDSITWSAGAGVIYSLDKATGSAYVITNYHVCFSESSLATDKIGTKFTCFIYGAETISLTDLNNLQYYNENCKTNGNLYNYDSEGLPIIDYGYGKIDAEYVGGSLDYDIAVLKISNSEVLKQSDVKAVDVANSNDVKPGSTAIAVGNPDACGISVTSGVVSVDSEYIGVQIGDESVGLREFRIDTPINSGNSGGGLFDNKGRLIGIVNAKTSSTEIDDMNYAIPSNIAVGIAQSIIDNCNGVNRKTSKVVLGIELETINSRAKYDESTGLYNIIGDIGIANITSGKMADKMGLKAGDIIKSVTIIRGEENIKKYSELKVSSLKINRLYETIDFFLNTRMGDCVKIEYLRDGVVGFATSTSLTTDDFVQID